MRGFLLQKKYPQLNKYYVTIPLIICIVYGGALEIMQYYIFSERSGDVGDFIANSFGCVCAVIFFGKLKKFLFLK
jgi:VanZ family protein